MFRPLHNRIVFKCIKVSTRSIFSVFQIEFEYKVDFGGAFELAEQMVQFLVEDEFVEGWHVEVKNTMSSRKTDKNLNL